MMWRMYQVLRPSRAEFIPIRTHRYHVRRWGDADPARPDLPPLVLLHGWMDVSASFQFMVDALQQDRCVIAPDWRGFGLTEGPATDHYWFPDYLADLDALLDHYSPGQPVDLVGHSMGGNVAMLYAGVRPERIRRLVNLEGFGMPATRPEQAGPRYAQWMDELRAQRQGENSLKTYDSLLGVAHRLMKTNPRLPADKAQWLASHWARENAQGRWEIRGDPAHKIVHAQLYRAEEVQSIINAISAPTLCVRASDDSLAQWFGSRFTQADFLARIRGIARLQTATLNDTGHMLHHDQPAALAQGIEDFLLR
jgi:pimeloyl-ACP methyl ester carboxylesterase